jgi:hypothetical protein
VVVFAVAPLPVQSLLVLVVARARELLRVEPMLVLALGCQHLVQQVLPSPSQASRS